MLDTMKATKIVAGLCGSLLIFLLLSWVAELFYSTGPAHDGLEGAAYVLETDEDEGEAGDEVAEGEAGDEVAEGPSFEDLFADADTAKGEKLFSKCKACHKLKEGVNSVGPSLFGVLDRDVASMNGYKYSGTLSAIDGNWTPEQLDLFLTKPKDFAADTKMTFSGLKKSEDRINLIAYLSTIGN